MGQKMRAEILMSTKLARPQSPYAKHHKEQTSWGVKIANWRDDWINLFGLGPNRPNKGDMFEIDLNMDTYAKDGAERVSYWADVITASAPAAAPAPARPVGVDAAGALRSLADSLTKPSVYSVNNEQPATPQPLRPLQPDSRPSWADYERVARAAHRLAVELEPRDPSVIDPSTARMAFVNTTIIAYGQGKVGLPPEEEIEPGSDIFNDAPLLGPDDDTPPF